MKYYVGILTLIFVVITFCKNNDKIVSVPKESNRLSVDIQSKIQLIDSLVQSLIDNNFAAGVSVGIGIGDNEPIIKSYGLADITNQQKVNSDHQFRIASITKMFTSTAIAKLIESGSLSFDESIDKYFPRFPNGNDITIYHLLSHTSGIPNWYETTLPEDTPRDFPMCSSPHTYIEHMKKPSLFEPGEMYYYSNTGYVLLGEIIGIVSDQSYEEYLERHIFTPAGMVHTHMERIENSSDRWVNGYDYNQGSENPFIAPEEYPMPFSAGGFRSTSADLLRFIKMLYSGTIISHKMRNKLTSYSQINSGEDVDEDSFYFPPDFERPTAPEYLKKYGYGLGFQRMYIFNSAAVWHGGGIAGFQTVLLHLPESDITISLLTNTGQGGGYGPIWEEVQKILTQINSD